MAEWMQKLHRILQQRIFISRIQVDSGQWARRPLRNFQPHISSPMRALNSRECAIPIRVFFPRELQDRLDGCRRQAKRLDSDSLDSLSSCATPANHRDIFLLSPQEI